MFGLRWMRVGIGSGALFFDAAGQVLIVKPTYKPDWGIPGGAVETGELMRAACVREVREELGLDVSGLPLPLLCVDSFRDKHGDRLVFIFDGGVLGVAEIGRIRLQESELSEYRFVEPEEAVRLLGPRRGPRVAHALTERRGAVASAYREGTAA